MQDPTPDTRGGMLFSAGLDTAAAILDEWSAHFWLVEVHALSVRDWRPSGAR
jgi:hypothetical protein